MTADANKAESMICMDRAREAIKGGDGEKAKRMLQKAKKLNPEQDITYLLKKADSLSGGASEASSASNGSQERSYAHDDHYEEPHLRSRKPTKNTHQKNGTAPSAAPAAKSAPKSRSGSRARGTLGVDYTQDQVNLVERIRHCKDYYEILAVQKTATDAQIKKEYRKLALNLHPDKCRAPHATEAFKALGSAYAVLSDKSKREQYDLYGPETSNGGGRGGRGGGGFGRRGRGDYFEYDYARGFESEFTADEIFNMFFGGGFPSEAVHRRRQHFHRQQQEHHQHQQRDDNPYAPLLQLMPLFAILILGMLAQFMVGDPAFQLQQSNKYPIQRTTVELKVPYFVRKDFDSNYRGGKLTQVERQVEDEYVSQLRMNCYKEQNQKETMIYRARIYQDVDLMKRAEKMNMPHCDRLRQIYH